MAAVECQAIQGSKVLSVLLILSLLLSILPGSTWDPSHPRWSTNRRPLAQCWSRGAVPKCSDRHGGTPSRTDPPTRPCIRKIHHGIRPHRDKAIRNRCREEEQEETMSWGATAVDRLSAVTVVVKQRLGLLTTGTYRASGSHSPLLRQKVVPSWLQ